MAANGPNLQIACKLQTLTLTAGLVGAAATMTSGTAADALAVLSALVKREDIGACTLVSFGYCSLVLTHMDISRLAREMAREHHPSSGDHRRCNAAECRCPIGICNGTA